MFKKIILSFIICISILFNNVLIGFADNIQYFNNIDSLQVAHVWIDGVNVRSLPNTKSQIIDMLNADQQVEVVAIYPGWAKVCLAIDSYGYICDQFIEYREYAATAPIYYSEPVYEEYSEPESEYISAYETYDIINQSGEDYYYEQPINNNDYYYEEEKETLIYNNNTEESINDYSYYEEEEEDYSYEDDYEEEQDLYEYEEEDLNYDNIENNDNDSNEENFYNEDVSSSSSGSYIVDYAKQYIGNPYVYGGNSLTDGVDCSGFTQQVFGNNGISLARTAADQSQGGTDVSMDDLQAGDLLFYDNGGYIGHVAIYNGDGTVTHASNESTGITISDANYRTPVVAKRYW